MVTEKGKRKRKQEDIETEPRLQLGSPVLRRLSGEGNPVFKFLVIVVNLLRKLAILAKGQQRSCCRLCRLEIKSLGGGNHPLSQGAQVFLSHTRRFWYQSTPHSGRVPLLAVSPSSTLGFEGAKSIRIERGRVVSARDHLDQGLLQFLPQSLGRLFLVLSKFFFFFWWSL